jgi:hypothetical protein
MSADNNPSTFLVRWFPAGAAAQRRYFEAKGYRRRVSDTPMANELFGPPSVMESVAPGVVASDRGGGKRASGRSAHPSPQDEASVRYENVP